jgi:hypothetical protein
MYYPLDIEIRFLERHYRGSSKFECCLQVTTEGDIPVQVVYPLGATWDEALRDYPTIEDIKKQITRLPEFSGWTLGVVDVLDAEGLY